MRVFPGHDSSRHAVIPVGKSHVGPAVRSLNICRRFCYTLASCRETGCTHAIRIPDSSSRDIRIRAPHAKQTVREGWYVAGHDGTRVSGVHTD